MADVAISGLPAAASADGAQQFEVNDGGTSRSITGTQLATFVRSGTTLSDVSDVTATAAELNKLDGATVTTAEINILDGVTATAPEINKIDADTAATATTVADADRVVFNDDDVGMKQVAMTDLRNYLLVDEDDMASDSATKLPTQQSVKAYVDDYGSPVLLTDGSSNLPGGLQIRWGVEVSTTDNDEAFTFQSAFSNQCFLVQLEFETSGRGADIVAKSNTGFTIKRDSNMGGLKIFNYIALGY